MKADIIEALVVYVLTLVVMIGGWTVVAWLLSVPSTTVVFLGVFAALAWVAGVVLCGFACVSSSQRLAKHFQSQGE
jgi:hypothetical protein